MRLLLYLLLGIILYRFIVRFLLPLFQITKMTGSQLRRMQREMEEMQQRADGREQRPAKETKRGDYIDYEEIKQ